jgi:DNA-binding NtrC family response regulator
VGITGYTVENVADELRASGFVELIQKPFDGDQLAQVVRRALDR